MLPLSFRVRWSMLVWRSSAVTVFTGQISPCVSVFVKLCSISSKIFLMLLLRQVQNLVLELEILHVQRFLNLNDQTRIEQVTDHSVRLTPTPIFDVWPLFTRKILHSNQIILRSGPLSHRQINELVIESWVIFFYFWEWRFFGRERKREIGFTLGQWEERRPAFEKEKIKMFQDREKNMNSWLPIIEHSKNPDSHCKQILSNRIDRLIDKQGSKDSTRVQRINIWT